MEPARLIVEAVYAEEWMDLILATGVMEGLTVGER